MEDAWLLSNEIYRAIIKNGVEIDEWFPRFIRYVIEYHQNNKKIDREKCIWGCAELDENNPDGWYDGFICPTCGYVRGMDKTPVPKPPAPKPGYR